jgi:hypothetical protein
MLWCDFMSCDSFLVFVILSCLSCLVLSCLALSCVVFCCVVMLRLCCDFLVLWLSGNFHVFPSNPNSNTNPNPNPNFHLRLVLLGQSHGDPSKQWVRAFTWASTLLSSSAISCIHGSFRLYCSRTLKCLRVACFRSPPPTPSPCLPTHTPVPWFIGDSICYFRSCLVLVLSHFWSSLLCCSWSGLVIAFISLL